ncbi:hypothetical protein PRIPAC_88230 [Pristionchus pacificus]|uniref:Uncharacterized protein n=1 Tax=Pristionchus pacificus TaxID=54126 RepID=A0A2A6CJ49_PRIPA|nr:hypothetical protein PRIPAC_88230 [Pristionchus pacificus]|eukprot:PDM78041.1 hypothetical protein PRIPAC_30426 [Pristionchus pacificus]
MLSLILLLLIHSSCQSSHSLSSINLCSDYTACKRESLSMENHCDHLERLEGKPKRRVEFVAVKNERVVEDTSICGVDLHPQYAKLTKHLLRFRREVDRCIAESLIRIDNDKRERMSVPLQQYCTVAISSNLTELSSLSSSAECWKAARFAHRKCADLRRCCEPAMICEQKASRSRNGRSIVLLKEEIGYRLADCRSMRGGERHKLFHRLDSIRENQPDDQRKNFLKKSIKRNEDQLTTHIPDADKIVISMKAPMPTDMGSLCSPYITCANHLFDYHLKCSAAQGIPKAGTHYVGEYMEECVMITDYDDHNEMNICNSDILLSPFPPIISSVSLLNSTCRIEESVRKGRCNALRSCCPRAQKCEKSLVYESLAHQFISSSADLKEKMIECYKKKRDKRRM